MSAIHAAKSQIAPLKRYVAQGTSASDAIARNYDAEGNAYKTGIAAGTTFVDMGKSIALYDNTYKVSKILRKVQLETLAGDGYTAYIYLTYAPSNQYFAALN